MVLTCAALLCEDETISTTLTAVPANNARATVALSSLFMALITHATVPVALARPAEATFKLWEAKPPIAAPILTVKQYEYSNVMRCTIYVSCNYIVSSRKDMT